MPVLAHVERRALAAERLGSLHDGPAEQPVQLERAVIRWSIPSDRRVEPGGLALLASSLCRAPLSAPVQIANAHSEISTVELGQVTSARSRRSRVTVAHIVQAAR